MRSKVLKIISLIAFLLLLSPSNVYFFVFYILSISVFVPVLIKKTGYFEVTVSMTSFMSSFIVNLILTVIFLHRWGFIIGSVPAMGISFLLSVIGMSALPRLLASVKTDSYPVSPFKNGKEPVYTYIICFIGSLIIMLIATRSTPLISFNDYNDANVMFTMGRGIVNGKVPYRDLIDRKGPIIYFIHAFSAWINPKSFTGVWIFEWLSCFMTMFWGIKLQKLIVPGYDLLSAILTFPLTAALYFTPSFLYGDTPEIFCVPLILYALYSCVNCLDDKIFSFGKSVLIGVFIGIVFWMKFNLCGAFIGMFFYLAFRMIRTKRFKILFQLCFALLLGLIIVTIPVLIVFAKDNAISDLYNVYFINNIFGYTLNSAPESAVSVLMRPLNMLGFYMSKNYWMYISICLGMVYLFKSNGKLFQLAAVSFITCFIFAFIGSKSFAYYAFILTAFAVIGWGPAVLLVKSALGSIKGQGVRNIAVSMLSLVLVLICLTECPNFEILFVDFEEGPVYQCSQYIQRSSNPTLICYDFLDRGFYTYNDIVPDVPYYTSMNSDYEYVRAEQERYIREGDYEFIITESEPHDFEGYDLLYTYQKEGDILTYYLYQKVS